VQSKALGAWLLAVGVGMTTRVRIAPHRDAALFPTAEEAERQAKEAALARIAELEVLLRRR
jgi:hypothetical protein